MESNKIHTLSTRSAFAQIKENGKRLSASKWMFLSYIHTKQALSAEKKRYTEKKNSEELQKTLWGWTISSKVGNSVLRNKLKRWCRLVAKDSENEFNLKGLSINVVFKPMPSGFYKNLGFSEFKAIFASTIRKIS